MDTMTPLGDSGRSEAQPHAPGRGCAVAHGVRDLTSGGKDRPDGRFKGLSQRRRRRCEGRTR